MATTSSSSSSSCSSSSSSSTSRSSTSLSSSPSSPSSSAVHSPCQFSLQRQHPEQTPADVFEALAEACRNKNNLLKTFDVYGDFVIQDKEQEEEDQQQNKNKIRDSDQTTTNSKSLSFLRQFEQDILNAFGGGGGGGPGNLEDAVFFPSGVMAQSVALLIHRDGKKQQQQLQQQQQMKPSEHHYRPRFACHHTSHLLLHEQEAYRELLGMEAVVLSTLDQVQQGMLEVPPLNYATVQKRLGINEITSDCTVDLKSTHVSTLILELPHREIGGKLTSWEDILLMRDFCRRHNIKFHCDGARILEASAGYFCTNNGNHGPITLGQLVEPFDSVYISFYKGLGGLSGAMLLGSKDFCRQARIWLRRFGGNLYTVLPYAVSGWMGFQRNWLLMDDDAKSPRAGGEKKLLSFVEKKDKLVSIVQALSTDETISSVVTFDPAIPLTNMVHGYLRASPADCERALATVTERCGIRVLTRVRAVVQEPAHSLGYRSYFEWAIGENNGNIPDSCFLEGWSQFAKELSLLE